MKALIQIFLFIFPWSIRRRILIIIFKYKIHPSARIGYSIILAKELEMEEGSRIHSFNLCKRIDRLIMRADSGIGSWNLITGFSSSSKVFKHAIIRKCELILEEHSGITLRHYLDCNGGIYIGAYSTLAGLSTQMLTHSINVYENCQDVAPIHIGRYCFLGTRCLLLAGSQLPDYSILAAGSTLNKAYSEKEEAYVFAGIPAKPVKKIDKENTKYFYREKHFVD